MPVIKEKYKALMSKEKFSFLFSAHIPMFVKGCKVLTNKHVFICIYSKLDKRDT